ncbi:MAG: hypothetical protein M3017_15800 [Actinomycetota bacterium]|nr:hypothetical protein [Actinomycetota bacterium]
MRSQRPAVRPRLEAITGSGHEPALVHADLARALDEAYAQIRSQARERGVRGPAPWPAIILRAPKGWTAPESVDGVRVEGTFRAHPGCCSDMFPPSPSGGSM